MGILNFLFGTKAAAEQDTDQEERDRRRKFATLKTDGVRARNIGEWQYAIRCLTEALRYMPDDAETQSYLAEAYIRVDDKAAAYPLLQKLAEVQPDNVEILLLLISTAASQRAWDVVTEAGDKAMALADGDARVFLIMAEAAHAREDNDAAISLLHQAISMQPDLIQAIRLRARLLRNAGLYEEAEADALRLIELTTDDDEGYVLLGKIYERSHVWDKALTAFGKARELNPFARKAIAGEVRVLTDMGRTDEAMREVDAAIADMPDFIEAYRLRAGLRRDAGDAAGAEADEAAVERMEAELRARSEDSGYIGMANRTEQRYRDLNPYKF